MRGRKLGERVMKPRVLSLSAEHVAKVHRVVAPPGPNDKLVYHTDEDYALIAEKILQTRPENGEIWLFAYGSLIWKPEVEHIAEEEAVAQGWHRSFCFKIPTYRGTVEQPGLMMALDRGGQCRGVIYQLDVSSPQQLLLKLFRREFTVKPPNSMPRWINVDTKRGKRAVLAFVMNRQSPMYVGNLGPDATADILATACGHVGSCAEYLYNTVLHLHERGIYDRNLWHLQQLVAARIDQRF
jgi:glutathione-specific gamma-glutamylcyclotransferase